MVKQDIKYNNAPAVVLFITEGKLREKIEIILHAEIFIDLLDL